MPKTHYRMGAFGEVFVEHATDWSGIVKVTYVLNEHGKPVEKTVELPGLVLWHLGETAAKHELRQRMFSMLEHF